MMKRWAGWLAVPAVLLVAAVGRGEESFAQVCDKVNPKLVKLFGSGGIRGLADYGTGVLISPDGYILTINSHILDTTDLRVHLYDGTRHHAKVVAIEPELDVALVKIGTDKDVVENLEYFDILEAAKRSVADPATGVLAFSNQFKIATRDEPMSVQRGVIASYGKLQAHIGVFEASYRGEAYIVDAITNNPGGAGGVLTTRKGEPLGLVGKELRNSLTNTWINYAIPFSARMTVPQLDGKPVVVSIADIVEKKEKYRPLDPRKKPVETAGIYTGFVLVPEVVERTPPYIEAIVPGSPAEKAGLKPDDLIVYVDGQPVGDIRALEATLSHYRPNTTIKLEVQRGLRLQTVPLTLDKPKIKKDKKKS
jgi:serine protease Do